MSDDWDAALYARKANGSLAGAERALALERYNNAANRAHDAAFQAAIAALLMEGIRGRDARWAHTFVHAEYVGKLINRRRRYSSEFRDTLAFLLRLRHDADYRGAPIKRADVAQAIRRSRQLVAAISEKDQSP